MVPLKKELILVQRPHHKSTPDSVGAPKTNHYGAIFIEFGDTKKCHTFGGLELVPQCELAISAACTKVKNALKSFGTIRKTFLFLTITKDARYVRSLGENLILGHTQRLKKVLRVVRCFKNAPERPIRMQITKGYEKKMFIV